MSSAIERVEAALSAIEQQNPRTNAFILIDAEGARAAARRLDEQRANGRAHGPLHGMPISLKDLIDVAGQPTTAGSNVRAGHVARQDAPVVRRLREAGAVLIGKTNLHEFAFGTTSEESAFGPVHNPLDESRSPGGSSGGSAAAVAAGMGDASIGTDTGGSIRIPAAACGIVGLKPSLDDVPTEGVVPLSTTLDHVGPLARTVADAAAVWAVVAGRSLSHLHAPKATEIRLGALGGYFTALLEREVRSAFDGALNRLRAAGVMISPCPVAGTEAIVDTYVAISMPEAAHWHGGDIDSRAADYQPPVLERLHRGRTIPAVDYLRALEMRQVLRDAVNNALETCDALVLPTLPIVAPRHGQLDAEMDTGETITVRAAMLRLTQLFNVTGHPAISLPVPKSGLPVGLQLVGQLDRTRDLLALAHTCETVLKNRQPG